MEINQNQSHPCADCNQTPVTRRNFLQLLATGTGVLVLHGCGSSSQPGEAPALGSSANPIAADPAGKEFRIAGAGKLPRGTALAFRLPDQTPGIVFALQDGSLHALSARCTHAGCIVEWQGDQKDALRCPCHGSRFDASGSPTNGPATKPLAAYRVRIDGDDAVIAAT